MGDYDAVIIGTGQSGPSLARRLVAAGQKVAVIERKFFGGICVNTGCTPTKTLIASAYAAHLARRGGDYGVVLDGPVRIDMHRVRQRAATVSDDSSKGVENWLRGMNGCTVFQGSARFEGAKDVRVGTELLSAPRIFINVGGRALSLLIHFDRVISERITRAIIRAGRRRETNHNCDGVRSWPRVRIGKAT